MKIVDGVKWTHYCEMPKTSEYAFAGAAISYCREYDDDKLFAGNEEYESQVNFCPICGYKSKIDIKKENDETKNGIRK